MRFVSDRHPAAALPVSLADFYRAEFIKHKHCLEQQRPYYSERAMHDVEEALTRVLGQLDQLCTQQNADEIVSRLLRTFDRVTGLSSYSAWSEQPTRLH